MQWRSENKFIVKNMVTVICLLPLKLLMEPKEEEISILWKAAEQVYRFGLGSIAGGELVDALVLDFFVCSSLKFKTKCLTFL